MIDVIVAWPKPCDYPLWRQFIRDERERFGRVYVVFTEHAGPDLSPFVRSVFPDVTFIEARGEGDWRDVAVNAALDRSTAEWVWFTEQDLIAGPWPDLTADAYGFPEGNGRWHPASLFVRRSIIDRTRRYFGTPPVDHFWMFSQELDALTTVQPLTGHRHFQAISESQILAWSGLAPRFRPEQFREWVALNLAANVPIDAGWAEAMA